VNVLAGQMNFAKRTHRVRVLAGDRADGRLGRVGALARRLPTVTLSLRSTSGWTSGGARARTAFCETNPPGAETTTFDLQINAGSEFLAHLQK
jgi:hypothetical protein